MYMNKIQDAARTSRRREPGFDCAGWHCWTGPSGTRYAAPGNKPSTVGVISAFSEMGDVPHDVCCWVVGGQHR